MSGHRMIALLQCTTTLALRISLSKMWGPTYCDCYGTAEPRVWVEWSDIAGGAVRSVPIGPLNGDGLSDINETETRNMRKLAIASFSAMILSLSSAAFAEQYEAVPAGDAQFKQCLTYTTTKYEGGEAASPIAGQTKAQAFCTCMWQETPEDFKGSLGRFADTEKGAKTNAICEKYSGWQ